MRAHLLINVCVRVCMCVCVCVSVRVYLCVSMGACMRGGGGGCHMYYPVSVCVFLRFQSFSESFLRSLQT